MANRRNTLVEVLFENVGAFIEGILKLDLFLDYCYNLARTLTPIFGD